MALTRPLINNLQTNVEIFSESMTVLHGGSSQANVDVGFVMNRANGIVSNVALYWSESLQSFVHAFTANAGVTASNITVQSYTTVTANASPATASTTTNSLGYIGLPQNSQSSGYTLVLADQGKHVYVTSTSTVTIPANSSVAFPIGSTINIIAASGVTVTVAITSDTLYLAGVGTTGSRSISPFGFATLVKLTSTSWIIAGTGVS